MCPYFYFFKNSISRKKRLIKQLLANAKISRESIKTMILASSTNLKSDS
jgi:hypothetical protein